MQKVLGGKNVTIKDEDVSKVSSYMLLKWLSGHPGTIRAANEFNKFYQVPLKVQMQTIKDVFGGKRLYVRYIKPQKDDSMLKKAVMWYYKTSPDVYKEYLEFMSDTEQDEVLNLYLEYKGLTE